MSVATQDFDDGSFRCPFCDQSVSPALESRFQEAFCEHCEAEIWFTPGPILPVRLGRNPVPRLGRFENAIRLTEHPKVLIDLRGLFSFTSEIWSKLIKIHRMCLERGGDFALCRPSKDVIVLFETSGLRSKYKMFETFDAGVDALSNEDEP